MLGLQSLALRARAGDPHEQTGARRRRRQRSPGAGRQGPQSAGDLRGLLAGAGRRDRARHGEVRLRQRRDARAHGRRRDGHRQLRGQDPQEEGQGPRHLEQPEGQEVARRHRRGSREQPRVRREADGRRRVRVPRDEPDRDADVQRHVRAEDRQRRDLRAASEGAEVHGASDERVHEDRQEARRPRQPRSDDQEGLRREDAGAHAAPSTSSSRPAAARW